MQNKEQIEEQLDISARACGKPTAFLHLPITSEIQKGIDYYMGCRDALQWVLTE